MNLAQFLISLWPFVREFFKPGKSKIPPPESGSGKSGEKEGWQIGIINHLQHSRRWISATVLLTVLSLLLNAKLISQAILASRDEKGEVNSSAGGRDAEPQPTIPKKAEQEMEYVYTETLEHLRELYKNK